MSSEFDVKSDQEIQIGCYLHIQSDPYNHQGIQLTQAHRIAPMKLGYILPDSRIESINLEFEI